MDLKWIKLIFYFILLISTHGISGEENVFYDTNDSISFNNNYTTATHETTENYQHKKLETTSAPKNEEISSTKLLKKTTQLNTSNVTDNIKGEFRDTEWNPEKDPYVTEKMLYQGTLHIKQIGNAASVTIVGQFNAITIASAVLKPESSEMYNEDDLIIYYGAKDATLERKFVRVKKVIIHPKYKLRPSKHNVCVIETRDPFIFDNNTNALELPSTISEPKGNTTCIWPGRIIKKVDSKQAGYANDTITDEANCTRLLALSVEAQTESSACTQFADVISKSPCQVKVGAPMMCNGVLIGFLTNAECFPENPATTYVKIKPSLSWMNSVLRKSVPISRTGEITNTAINVFYFTQMLSLFLSSFICLMIL